MKKGLIAGLSFIAGGVTGAFTSGKAEVKKRKKTEDKVAKFKGYYNMLNVWLDLKQNDGSLVKYFEKKGYKRIAIYGMGEMGERLYQELRGSMVKVIYAVDQTGVSVFPELNVVSKDMDLDSVDAMVITATFAYEEIVKEIKDKVDFPLISLDDVVYGV